MSDEKWAMPEWMREALRACKYSQADIDDADQYYNPSPPRLVLGDESGILASISDTIIDLGELRAAGRLLTEGEKRERDEYRRVSDGLLTNASATIMRLKSENAALHSRCVMEENELFRDLRAENERLQDLLRTIRKTSREQLTLDLALEAIKGQGTALGADDDT